MTKAVVFDTSKPPVKVLPLDAPAPTGTPYGAIEFAPEPTSPFTSDGNIQPPASGAQCTVCELTPCCCEPQTEQKVHEKVAEYDQIDQQPQPIPTDPQMPVVTPDSPREAVTMIPQPAVLVDMLIEQMGREIYSSLLYLHLSSCAQFVGYQGCAKFFKSKYDEERGHADRIFNYLNDRQYVVPVEAIPRICVNATDIHSFFIAALDHEKMITKSLNLIYQVAKSEDSATAIFLEWFVHEQVEEEAGVKNVLDRIKLAAGNTAALLQIDREIAG